MDGFDAWVASKVCGVKGEDTRDTVGEHGSGKLGIVDLNTTNIVCGYQRAPNGVDIGVVGEKGQQVLNIPPCERGFLGGEAIAVSLTWTRGCIPELSSVLKSVMKLAARLVKPGDGLLAEKMLLQGWICHAKQNVGVEDVAWRHDQSWSS
jgi:hypothetical protein